MPEREARPLNLSNNWWSSWLREGESSFRKEGPLEKTKPLACVKKTKLLLSRLDRLALDGSLEVNGYVNSFQIITKSSSLLTLSEDIKDVLGLFEFDSKKVAIRVSYFDEGVEVSAETEKGKVEYFISTQPSYCDFSLKRNAREKIDSSTTLLSEPSRDLCQLVEIIEKECGLISRPSTF